MQQCPPTVVLEPVCQGADVFDVRIVNDDLGLHFRRSPSPARDALDNFAPRFFRGHDHQVVIFELI
jgi:hypothetical protein